MVVELTVHCTAGHTPDAVFVAIVNGVAVVIAAQRTV